VKRREFITLVGGAAAWPLAARAQQPNRVRRIGYLVFTSAPLHSKYSQAFRMGLRDLGYVEGKNIVIEFRFADGNDDRISSPCRLPKKCHIAAGADLGRPGPR
jgi:putative ABC transport system substrate-binding protein